MCMPLSRINCSGPPKSFAVRNSHLLNSAAPTMQAQMIEANVCPMTLLACRPWRGLIAATTQIGNHCYIRWPEGLRGQITDERALHRYRSSWLHLLCPAWRETGGIVISHAPNHNLSLRCNLAAPLAS